MSASWPWRSRPSRSCSTASGSSKTISPSSIVLSLLVAVGLAVARGSLGRVPPSARRGLIAVLPVVFLVLFWGGYGLGEATARTQFLSDREADFPAHPRVRVWGDPGWANAAPLAPLASQLAQGCHRLLAQSRETVFLFPRSYRFRRPASRWSRCRPPPSRRYVFFHATRAVSRTRRQRADSAGATTTLMWLPTSILCIALFAGPIEAAESNPPALARLQEINQQVTDAYRGGDYVRALPLAREAPTRTRSVS